MSYIQIGSLPPAMLVSLIAMLATILALIAPQGSAAGYTLGFYLSLAPTRWTFFSSSTHVSTPVSSF